MTMKRLVELENIRLKVPVQDWQDAVTKVGAILEENGYVTHEYIGAMIQTVKTLGPYIVVAPGLAMPHAKSTCGVLKSGIGIMTLETPVEFGNESNDPVYMLIGLAGVNDSLHLDILQAIATIFEDESMLQKMSACEHAEEIADIFNNVTVMEER